MKAVSLLCLRRGQLFRKLNNEAFGIKTMKLDIHKKEKSGGKGIIWLISMKVYIGL